jgi:hypothetical protein
VGSPVAGDTASYVLWATTKLVDVSKLPDQTVVVRFDMRDRPADQYWLILRKPHPELCTRGLGFVEDIVAHTDSSCLVDIHLRRTSYADAVRNRRLVLDGAPELTRAFTTWIRQSPFVQESPNTSLAAGPSET